MDGGINPYIYAEGNPIIAIDPLGLKECSYHGWWGKPSFKVNSVSGLLKLGSGLPNKWLAFHILSVVFNVNGTITLEVNCLKVCDKCDGGQKWHYWKLNPSYSDTVSPEFKIRKGVVSLVWKFTLANLTEVDYADVKEKYYDKAISVLKSELTKKAINLFGDATTYCKMSGK